MYLFNNKGGHSLYFIMLNTFAHTVMYTYYFLSSWKPDLHIIPRLKVLVTQVQLVIFNYFFFCYNHTHMGSIEKADDDHYVFANQCGFFLDSIHDMLPDLHIDAIIL